MRTSFFEETDCCFPHAKTTLPLFSPGSSQEIKNSLGSKLPFLLNLGHMSISPIWSVFPPVLPWFISDYM